MKHPQRQCIFCDNPVGSKEHIWSQWMHSLLEGQPHNKYNRQTIATNPRGERRISGPTGKPGNVYDIQVRAVCRPCNQGWMNVREQAVRPFLETMIKGDPTIITDEQMLTLALWCAQKFIVMEHAELNTAVTPRADRLMLRDGTIPPYFRIYVGNHLSKSRSASIRHSHTLARSRDGPTPPLDGTYRNIETITVIMGRLFLHLNAARVDNFEIETSYKVSRVWAENRIWPDPNSAPNWPRRPVLSDTGLRVIAGALEAIQGCPKVKWIDAHT